MIGSLAKRFELRGLPRLVATEFKGEFAGKLRGFGEGRARIEKQQARSTGEHVFNGSSHLISGKPGSRAVVLSRIVDGKVASDAGTFRELAENGCMIHGIFRHVAIRGPFPAGDRK